MVDLREFTNLRYLFIAIKGDGDVLMSIFCFDDCKTIVGRGDVSIGKGIEEFDIFGGVHGEIEFDITPSQTEYGAAMTEVERTVVAGRAEMVMTVFACVCRKAEREEPVVENVPTC